MDILPNAPWTQKSSSTVSPAVPNDCNSNAMGPAGRALMFHFFLSLLESGGAAASQGVALTPTIMYSLFSL